MPTAWTIRAEADADFTPTPAVSRAIIVYNKTHDGPRADGIVVTPSHNPPRDGGFKYNPPHGGPADTDATGAIASRANELLRDPASIKRTPYERAASDVTRVDYLGAYCEDLRNALDIDAIAHAGVHIGADPLGGASVQYWGYISERLGIDLTVINPAVDPDLAVHDARLGRQDPDGLLVAVRDGQPDRQPRPVRRSPPATTPTPTGTASSPRTPG